MTDSVEKLLLELFFGAMTLAALQCAPPHLALRFHGFVNASRA